ncbi:PAM68 family protein [Sphaerospermopsis aphanizomenoides BCCUSP55]|uniref:PAM68 family protein n=1 Tax=Sphaerospermopsis aphanizomenoides TaxID=459663 RepID=UPI000AB14796|nr:PAM68 family protein [Sphaerospermopsis aphanizomenoides]MBK1986825.1 PAM68 family protein [Sphaerospermopsis aphanizomenoides BCCUSP55]
MSAEESEHSRLPFEPNKKRQKPVKAKSQPTVKAQESSQKQQKQPPFSKEEMAIPEVVSQRMMRRVAAFCGIPTTLGIASLVASYLLVIYAHIQLPPIAVLLVNMGFFGLGVLGITYGVLSASWDEERPGNLLGLSEFGTNWGRMAEVWRETRKKNV